MRTYVAVDVTDSRDDGLAAVLLVADVVGLTVVERVGTVVRVGVG